MRPTALAPAEAEWVETKMREYCAAGIAEPVEHAQCTCNVVLVKAGQSGQEFRLCSNFTRLNPHSRQPTYPMPNARELLDNCVRGRVYSTLDLKAGFHNVELTEATKAVSGIAT